MAEILLANMIEKCNYENNYISWGDYAVWHNSKTHKFSLKCLNKQKALNNIGVESIIVNGENIGGLETFKQFEYRSYRLEVQDFTALKLVYKKGLSQLPTLTIKLVLSDKGLSVSVNTPKNCVVNFTGEFNWGKGGSKNCFPMSLSSNNEVVRSAIGPASSNKDNMLFDRLSDNGIVLEGAKKARINYDWNKKKYAFIISTGATQGQKQFHVYVVENILANKFKIKYSPFNRNRTFSAPPMGWMTWYAVKFDACEEKVLKNAKWQAENLKEYGANSVWVDWEWCHKDFAGGREDETDNYHPDKVKYPHGLDYVASEIKKLGMVPCLWLGYAVEPRMCDFLKENPDTLLVDYKWWCGKYYFDYSHPKYLNEYLPKAFKNAREWGYDAIKFDTVTQGKIMNEKHHAKLYNPNLTSKDLQRKISKIARENLGEDCYMLSCAQDNDGDILWACDMFDSARVGGDIFNWDSFIKEGMIKALRFYPLHNNAFICDCDNIVLREQYNDYMQAASRVYFVAMLGMPVTFGDEFDALDEARINLIKTALPVLDVHPMDVNRQTKLGKVLKMNLAVAKEWENYNVVNVFNNNASDYKALVDIPTDLSVDEGKYLVFDYTKDEFIGVVESEFEVDLKANESRVFSVRKLLDRPQLLSTSRHITQGAAEIKQTRWSNDKKQLTLQVELIANAPYSITIYCPNGYTPKGDLVKLASNVYRKTIVATKSGLEDVVIEF